MNSAWRYPFALLGIVFVLIGYAFWPRHDRIPVLVYHDIASSTQEMSSYTVEQSLLARELDYLKTEGYTTLSFASEKVLREQKKIPEKAVILTFDDALPGQMLALVTIREHQMTATFFLTSGLVGDAAHLSWQQVHTIAGAGMEIGGHTATHVHPLQLTSAALTNEIVSDKHHIEAEVGHPITVFAYPFLERSTATDAIVADAGYTIVRDTNNFRSTVLTNSFDAFLKAL